MNIYLTGYRGSGKTTVAKVLGNLLAWPVVDSDDEIEILVGKTITEIFDSGGEPEFRKWEATVVDALSMLKRHVISLGGGAVLAQANRDRLKLTGKTVWLKASAETCHARICADENSATMRPNLTQSGGIVEIEQMLAARSPIYQSVADLVVDTQGKTPVEIATSIFDHFEPHLLDR